MLRIHALVMVLFGLIIQQNVADDPNNLPDPPVCTAYDADDTSIKPQMSSDFTVKIEEVRAETNEIFNIIMYYSMVRNTVKVTYLEADIRNDYYYYFQDNEILKIQYGYSRGNCTVIKDLQNSKEAFLVGGSKGTKIQPPLAALHFSGKSGFGNNDIKRQKLLKSDPVRDMPVVGYSSCQTWPVEDNSIVVNVTHYFSDKAWHRPAPQVVPVQMIAYGTAVVGGKIKLLHHYYNFFDFRDSVDPLVFETPAGVVCKGRKADLPFPTLPKYIKMSLETVDRAEGLYVSYSEEIYDSFLKIAVARSQTLRDVGSQGGMNHMTIIRDYPTGLSYTIDSINRVCVIQNISQSAPLPFDYMTPQGKIKEVQPEQFFYKNEDKYYYIGKRTIRGVLTDTWVTKTNMPQFPDKEVTVEWYFATDNVRSWNDGSYYYKNNKFRMPVLFRMWTDDSITKSIDVNIYHVDFTHTLFGEVDVRDCYPNKQSNYFQIILDGAKQDVLIKNIDDFKWQTALSLAKAAGVRWLRISDLQIYFEDNDTVIEFEILDAPPYSGDVDGGPIKYQSLQNATNSLKKAIQKSTLVINTWNPSDKAFNKPAIIKTNPKIAANKAASAPDDDGYSTGAMAGLGVGMVIVGGLFGGIGSFVVLRR